MSMSDVWWAAQQSPDPNKAIQETQDAWTRRAQRRTKAKLYLERLLAAKAEREAAVQKFGAEDCAIAEYDAKIRRSEAQLLVRGMRTADTSISDLQRLIADEGALDDFLTYSSGWPT